MIRIGHQNIPANRFRLFRFIQISIQLRFSDGLADSRFGDGLQLQIHIASFRNAWLLAVRRSADLSRDPHQRIVISVHDALLQRNDGIVRDMDVLGTNFRAALRNIAVAQPQLILQHLQARNSIQRMHLESRYAYKESRPAKLRLLVVIAQNVANVLAQEALNTLSKFLHPVSIFLIKLPVRPRLRLERWNLL